METATNNEHFCLFCYRIFNRNKVYQTKNVDDKMLVQFLLLSKRYLINDNVPTFRINPLLKALRSNESVRNVISPCDDCSGILKTFCEYYEEIKVLEMKLEWTLKTLTNIMKSSEKVKARRRLFQEKVESQKNESDSVDFLEHLKNFRKELVEKCTGMFKDTYPKVKLKRCDFSHKSTLSSRKRHHQDDDGIQEDNSSKVPKLDLHIPDSNSNDKVDLLTEILNEPDLKIESSADTIMPPKLDERVNEIEMIEEIQSSGSEGIVSPVGSPIGSIISQDCNNDGDIETTVEVDGNVIGDKQQVTEAVTKPTSASCELINSFAAIKAEIISAVDFRTNSQLQLQETQALESENNESYSSDPNIAFNSSDSDSKSPETNATPPEPSVDNEPEAKTTESGVSLRRRYPCARCPQKFSSSAKLQEHIENCIPSGNNSDDESEANHSSGTDFEEDERDCDSNTDEFWNDDEGESEDSKPLPNDFKGEVELLKNFDKSRLFAYKLVDYTFLETTFECKIKKCDFVFYNQADLDNHSKLHGDFKCSSCKTTKSYAPDLAHHELKHKLKLCRKIKSKNMACLEESCTHVTNKDFAFIKHFLTCHLKLPLNTHTCPICKFPVSAEKRNVSHKIDEWALALKIHMRTHHNLNNEGIEAAAARCDVQDCPAYFRKLNQLYHHQYTIHGRVDMCEECGEEFTSKDKLLLHQQTVHENRFNLACEISGCTERFKDMTGMKNHVLLDHSIHNPSNICYFCGQTFETKLNMITHQNLVHNKIELDLVGKPKVYYKRHHQNDKPWKDRFFKCRKCSEKFYNRQNLESHVKLHGDFKCFFCEEPKTYAPDLALHEASCKSQENEKQKKTTTAPKYMRKKQTHYCPHCDFEPTRYEMNYIQHHLQAHMNLELVVGHMCCVCKWTKKGGREFRKQFASHYITHHYFNKDSSQTVYNCDNNECDAYFLTEDQLSVHKLNIHNEKSSYPCPDCDKVFPTKLLRKNHRKNMHKNKMNISCSHQGCPLRFHDEESMQQHCYHVHSKKVKPEICPTCGKTFQGLSALATHTRNTHSSRPKKTKTKNFMCPECGKGFFSKENLDWHRLGVHVGPDGWEFTCDICQKKCMTEQKLEEHKRTHTQEKPFTCELCGLCYAHRHNFRIHLKSKHGIILARPKGNNGKKKQ